MHAAAAGMLLATVALLFVRAQLALLPPLLLLAAVAAAPYFPAWSFFMPIFRHGPRGRREVALTFDDGPDPRSVRHLLQLLREAGVKATFFLVGRRAASSPEAVRDILGEGHDLGNHSFTHDVFLATRGEARVYRELSDCQDALKAYGVRPLVYRPPVGITSPPLRRPLEALGLRCVAWSCRPLDFGNRRLGGLASRVLRRVRPGDVILLHDALPEGQALEPFLEEVRKVLWGLKERGLAVVSLSKVLGVEVMERVPAEDLPQGPAGREAGPGSETGSPAPGGKGRVSDGLTFLFTLAYPFAVALSLRYLEARSAALLLLGLHLLFRLRTLREDLKRARGLVALAASVAVLLCLAALFDDPRFLLAYPVLVNAALLLNFGFSLRGVPIAERFARMETSELTPPQIRYCRNVTLVWCGFFVLNGSVAALLALFAPQAVWAIYTGGVSYVLVGLTFAVEYVIRKARWGHFGPGLVDRTLERFFAHPGSTR